MLASVAHQLIMPRQKAKTDRRISCRILHRYQRRHGGYDAPRFVRMVLCHAGLVQRGFAAGGAFSVLQASDPHVNPPKNPRIEDDPWSAPGATEGGAR
jgi:hypothetical protein